MTATSAEDVERLANYVDISATLQDSTYLQVAATLRALLAERDAAVERVTR